MKSIDIGWSSASSLSQLSHRFTFHFMRVHGSIEDSSYEEHILHLNLIEEGFPFPTKLKWDRCSMRLIAATRIWDPWLHGYQFNSIIHKRTKLSLCKSGREHPTAQLEVTSHWTERSPIQGWDKFDFMSFSISKLALSLHLQDVVQHNTCKQSDSPIKHLITHCNSPCMKVDELSMPR